MTTTRQHRRPRRPPWQGLAVEFRILVLAALALVAGWAVDLAALELRLPIGARWPIVGVTWRRVDAATTRIVRGARP